mgnify:FL=1|jgi:hypothetical protein
MSTVIDVSTNRDTGEIEQFTIINEQGQPELMKATATNMLLYDPMDELPFDGGLGSFLSGDEAILLSEEPKLIVSSTSSRNCFIIHYDGNTVETTPAMSESVLRGVKEAAVDEDIGALIDVYDEVMSTQVRRDVINALLDTFDETFRIEKTPSGWVVDEFFIVDWTASMYAKTDDPDSADVVRSGSGVVEADRSFEFVQLYLNREIEPVTVSINGESFRLSEREMLFLGKVNWLLDRRHYHPDDEFWMNVDQYTAVDWETGEPVEQDEDEPDLSKFSL